MHRYSACNLLIILSLLAVTALAANKPEVDELMKMQDFHLQQAQEKLANKQLAQAWGDFAYLLCQIPNHHAALTQMLVLAPQLDKQEELATFFDKALKAYPQDEALHALYAEFVRNYFSKK